MDFCKQKAIKNLMPHQNVLLASIIIIDVYLYFRPKGQINI